MTPTRPRLLAALVVVSAAVGWGVVRLVDAYLDRSLPVPWTAALVMLVLAVALALWARGTRARLSRRPGTKPMDPIVAARSAALAMAASRTGAIVAGFYAGVTVGLLPGWSVPYVRDRVIVSAATVLTASLVVAAALWLERVCRVPPDASDDPKP
jgi:heme A synthase